MGETWMRKWGDASCAPGLWFYVLSLYPASSMKSDKFCTVGTWCKPRNYRVLIQNWYNQSIMKNVVPRVRCKNGNSWCFLMKIRI